MRYPSHPAGGEPASGHDDRGPRALPAALATVAAGVLLVVVLRVLPATDGVSRQLVVAIDDGAQLLAAAAAVCACARVSLRTGSASRVGWVLLTAGLGCWLAGQVVWTFIELVLRDEAPFPSLADVGFLLFPLVTSVGLASWLRSGEATTARARDLLDGAVIACSLFALSWVITLGPLYQARDGDPFAFALSVAYPLGDVVMGTLVILALSRVTGQERATLVMVASGLGGLAVADSAYVYLVTAGDYGSGDVISAGWVVGFGLIAVGARRALRRRPAGPAGGRAAPTTSAEAPSMTAVALPYVPLALGGAAVVGALLRVPGAASVELGLGLALVALVLGRQFVAMTENRRLLIALQKAQDQLERQALHDHLTGLPNRALFADRLEHALAVQDRLHDGTFDDEDRRAVRAPGVAVLFCDLNLFKQVNDTLGHAVGDDLLRAVAHRIRSCLRPEDTVARLGGDEFAVLLESCPDPGALAQRLVDSVDRPFLLGGSMVRVSLSAGVAVADSRAADHPAVVARELLRMADGAMYAAKRTGRGQAVLSGGLLHADVAVGNMAD
jgi:diguanylate cyclase (GGDEF)-like protein